MLGRTRFRGCGIGSIGLASITFGHCPRCFRARMPTSRIPKTASRMGLMRLAAAVQEPLPRGELCPPRFAPVFAAALFAPSHCVRSCSEAGPVDNPMLIAFVALSVPSVWISGSSRNERSRKVSNSAMICSITGTTRSKRGP